MALLEQVLDPKVLSLKEVRTREGKCLGFYQGINSGKITQS